MRLDKFLKVSRLIKRRTIAKSACDNDRIMVNGKTARASTNLEIGDEITINMGTAPQTVKVLELKEHVTKESVDELYQILG